MDRLAEHLLHQSNYPAWCEYIAPRWVQMLAEADDERAAHLVRIAKPELKRAIWAIAPGELKARLQELKSKHEPAETA